MRRMLSDSFLLELLKKRNINFFFFNVLLLKHFVLNFCLYSVSLEQSTCECETWIYNGDDWR